VTDGPLAAVTARHEPECDPDVDRHWMALALAQAAAAEQAGEVPVGAVLVRDGECLAQAHNAPIGERDPTAHAEIRALRAAARAENNYRLPGTTLYVTLEPCPMCAGAILQARVPAVVWGAADPKAGAVATLYRLFEDQRLNHRVEHVGHVLADDCGRILTEFFRRKR